MVPPLWSQLGLVISKVYSMLFHVYRNGACILPVAFQRHQSGEKVNIDC